MAKKSKSSKANAGGLKKNVENYEHKGAKRLNNPPVGLVNMKTEKVEQKKTYKFDPHLSPQLQWAGKEERSMIELPTVSLHVHERIDPKTIIEAVRSSDGLNWEQMNLFNRPINKLNFIKEIQFYQHEKDWSNRLIAGDSLLVMNSLLEKEGMAGRIQTIYFDPPYGIKYGSNFQPFVNKREVRDGSDDDLVSEPEMLQAFRDTWELGVHSYLGYLRDRILMCRLLLSESGSCFLQISDDNLHLVRAVMDEIFGRENFVSQIAFQKTGGQRTNLIASTYDYILWYAKDKNKVKYRQLYLQKTDSDVVDSYNMVELPSGERRRITREEASGATQLPNGSRRFQLTSLTSQNPGSRYEVSLNGKTFFPSNGQWWKTDLERMNKLIAQNRIMPSGNTLRYVRYLDDFPAYPLTSVWNDTAGGVGGDKIYVVQTNPKVVERCILMSSDPGDIVFDPTLGSGTTAVCAEKFGRKWIVCDTSRVAVTLSKQRLMTEIFDYFVLKSPDEGVDSGFEYKTISHITLKSLANNESSPEEILYDQPAVDNKKARITGPFTVEAVPAPIVKTLDSGNDEVKIHDPSSWIDELRKSGIRLPKKQTLKISRLELATGTKWIHADGETDENPAQRIVVSFGPNFAPLEQRQVELALQEVEKLRPSPTVVVFAAFQFDPEAAKDIDEIDWGGVSVLKVQMNADLFTEDLKKKRSSNESFWLVGQPDISVDKIKSGDNKGKFRVSVNGFDYYNTKSGTIESGGASKIAMWLLDSDYDGRSLLPKQVFFPMADKNEGWGKLAKLLKAEIDQDLVEAYRGIESLPFEAGENKKIAIKIIDDRGIESLTIRELE